MAIRIEDGFSQWLDLESNTTYVTSSGELDLSKVLQTQTRIVVEADSIRVAGRVNFAGQSVSLTCRTLQLEDAATLVSEGLEGSGFSEGVLPAPRSSFGEIGNDGADGKPGASGGDISIWAGSITGNGSIESVGGAGGRGQDGGDGTQGSVGLDGPSITIYSGENRPPRALYRGGQGATGGACGLPGRNGLGAPSGRVDVWLLLPLAGAKTLACRTASGSSGANANAGRPGSGGTGGRPGNLREAWSTDMLVGEGEIENNDDPHYSQLMHQFDLPVMRIPPGDRPGRGGIRTIDTGDAGPVGEDGDKREAEVDSRRKFRAGTTHDVAVANIRPQGFIFSALFLEAFVCAVEDRFRANGTLSDVEVRQIQFYLDCLDGAAGSTLISYFNRFYSILAKVGAGMDFYGYRPDQVGIFSIERTSQLADILIRYIEIIEDSYNDVIRRTERKEDLTEPIKTAIETSRFIKNTLDDQAEELRTELTRCYLEFPKSLAAIALARKELENAHEKLLAAIRSKNRCDWKDTLIAVGSIAISVYTVGAGVGVALAAKDMFVSSWNQNNQSLKTLFDARELLGKDGKKIVDAAKDVNGAVSDIQKYFNDLDQNSKENALPTIEVSKSHFDEIVKQYTDLPEAKEYRDLGYTYLARIEARHNAIASYDTGLLRLCDLSNQARMVQSTIQTATGSLNRLYDRLPELLAGLWSIRRASIDTMANLLHSYSKAVGYHFGEYVVPRIQTRSVAELSASRASIFQLWLNRKAKFLPARKSKEPIEISLSEFSLKSDWDRFAKSGQVERALVFKLDPDRWPLRVRADGAIVPIDVAQTLESYALLRITGFSVNIDVDGKTSVPIGVKWYLTHPGYEKMLIKRGITKIFTRFPVIISGAIDDKFESDRSDEKLYAGVSPFTTWRLVFDDPYKNITGKITAVRLLVDGYTVAV